MIIHLPPATEGGFIKGSSLHHFFLPPTAIQQDQIRFPAETAHQILRVLRLQPGETVAVMDNLGSQYMVELAQVSREGVVGRVLQRAPAAPEPPVSLHLYVCLTQREKFEWILQKCCEVGVSEFTPVISTRALVQDLTAMQNKYSRWQRILQEAAEQSGRGRIPLLHPPQDYAEAVQAAMRGHDRCLAAWEEETGQHLLSSLDGLPNQPRLALLIGPEGGLTEEEVELARQAGWVSVSLGPRILRMETAAVAAAALVVSVFENRAD